MSPVPEPAESTKTLTDPLNDAITHLIRVAISAVTANASAAAVEETGSVLRAREHLAKLIGREMAKVPAPQPPARKTREQMDAGLGAPYQEVVDALLWSRRDFIDSAYTAESAGALAELREKTQEAEYTLRAMIDRLARATRVFPHYPPLKPLVKAYGLAVAMAASAMPSRVPGGYGRPGYGGGVSEAEWTAIETDARVQSALDVLYSANLNDR